MPEAANEQENLFAIVSEAILMRRESKATGNNWAIIRGYQGGNRRGTGRLGEPARGHSAGASHVVDAWHD